MRIAFFANNQFLLMTAVNLKCTVFSSDEMHIYTPFKFSNFVFEKVFLVKDIGVIEETNLNLSQQMKAAYIGAEDFLDISKGIVDTYGENPVAYQYDMVIAMGYTYFPFWLTSINRKNGVDTKLIRISDGVVFKYSDINYHFNKNFKEVIDNISLIKDGFQAEMLYNSKFCPTKKHQVIEIPQIDEQAKCVIKQMDLLSGFLKSKNKLNDYKYIFFTSSTINGRNFFINETQVIQQVAQKVGNNNLIVCPHPWRNVSDLSKIGVNINNFKWAAEFLYPHINLEDKI